MHTVSPRIRMHRYLCLDDGGRGPVHRHAASLRAVGAGGPYRAISSITRGIWAGISRARNPSRPTVAASRSPARPCRWAPHTAACTGSAPRASSPAVSPARTSPEPETPSPAPPLSSRHSRPPGAATQEVAPPSPTAALARRASSWVAPAGSSSTSSCSTCNAMAISVGLGVSTTRAFRCSRQDTSAVTEASPSASRATGPRRCGSSLSPNPCVSSTFCMPGPMSTASAASARSRTTSAASARITPESLSGSARTRASGSAVAANGATDSAVATWSLPAPARSAASAASSTAPRVSLLPPITRIEPRAFLPPVGSGSGQRRSTCGVTRVESGLLGDMRLLGDLLVVLFQVVDAVVGDQAQLAVGGLVAGDGGVGDALATVDLEQLLLGQPFQHVPEDHDHRLVGHQQQPLAVVSQRLRGQEAPDPQRDVRPALAARRAVVELAQQVPAPRLVRVLLADPGAGHPIERPEVAFPEPLVGAHGEADRLRGQLRRRQGPGERGAEHRRGALVLRQVRHPPPECLRLGAAGLRQRHVGIADVELQPAGALFVRLRVGEV